MLRTSRRWMPSGCPVMIACWRSASDTAGRSSVSPTRSITVRSPAWIIPETWYVSRQADVVGLSTSTVSRFGKLAAAASRIRSEYFDKVLAVHTIYFWADPLEHLREVHRVLKNGGIFVLGFRPRGEAGTDNFPPSVYTFHSADEVHSMLAAAGFTAADVSPATKLPSFWLARARRNE